VVDTHSSSPSHSPQIRAKSKPAPAQTTSLVEQPNFGALASPWQRTRSRGLSHVPTCSSGTFTSLRKR